MKRYPKWVISASFVLSPFVLLSNAELLAARRAPSAQTTPYSENELRATETASDSKLRTIRNEELTQLRLALGRRNPTHRRADLYFRLAEIYIELYRSEYLLEGRVHEQRLEKGKTEPSIDHAHSRPYLGKAVQACQDVLSLNIPFEKLDHIYYFLGFNYWELGQREKSEQAFAHLVSRFPQSPFAPEAYRELGESSFSKGHYAEAQQFFQTAAQKANPELLPRIYHKLAWSQYRTKQYSKAIETMKLSVSAAQKSGEKLVSLKEEALRDMAVFMTESGQVEEAIRYFATAVNDPQYYPKLLERLGKQYERNVESDKSKAVYESLLKSHPTSEATIRARAKLFQADQKAGKYPEALRRLDGMQVGQVSDPTTRTAIDGLKVALRKTATEAHQSYRKDQGRESLDRAEAYYAAYLSFLGQIADPLKETSEISMYLAEVKRDLGKSKEASDLYRSILKTKDGVKATPEQLKYAKEAGALWTASLSEAIRKMPKSDHKAAEPSVLEKEFVEAADQLRAALGNSVEGRESALRAAEVLAGYSATQKDAISRTQNLIESAPTSVQANTAALLLLQTVHEFDPTSMGSWLEKLKAREALIKADGGFGGKLAVVMRQETNRLKIGEISQHEKDQDFGAAAKGYEDFSNSCESRELCEKALMNAVEAYQKSSNFDGVERVLKEWMKRYPQSLKQLEVGRSIATQLLIRGDELRSARFFELLGMNAADIDSLETAGRIYLGIGRSADTIAVWNHYLAKFASAPSATQIRFELALVHAAAGHEKEAIELLQQGGAYWTRIAEIYDRLRQDDLAKQAYSKATSGGSLESSFAVYKLGELLEKSVTLLPLKMPEAELKKAVQQRLELFERLNQAYLSAVQAGGPWGVAAVTRLSAFAWKFSRELDQVVPPADWDAAAVKRFKKSLESVTLPLKKKALESATEAYSKAQQGEILSPGLPELSDLLSEMAAGTPRRAQGSEPKYRLAGMPADGGDEGKNASLEKTRERLIKNPKDASAWIDLGNLMWGEGKPRLSQLAYDRALALDPKNPAALNNRGVLAAQPGKGYESWRSSLEADHYFAAAVAQDSFFVIAKFNRARLLNYFRLFDRAKPLWDQVLAKAPSFEALDGQAVTYRSLGHDGPMDRALSQARESGAKKVRFENVFQEAARYAEKGDRSGFESCLDRLSDFEIEQLQGFERESVLRLKELCERRKRGEQ